MNKTFFLFVFALSNFATPCFASNNRGRSLDMLESLRPAIENNVAQPIPISKAEQNTLMTKQDMVQGSRIFTYPVGFITGYTIDDPIQTIGLCLATLYLIETRPEKTTYTAENNTFDVDQTPFACACIKDCLRAAMVGNAIHRVSDRINNK